MLEGDRLIRTNRFVGWQPQLYSMRLANRTQGIVGMGVLGKALAQSLSGFEMQLLYCDPVALPEGQELAWGLSKVSLALMEWWNHRPGFTVQLWQSEELVLIVPPYHHYPLGVSIVLSKSVTQEVQAGILQAIPIHVDGKPLCKELFIIWRSGLSANHPSHRFAQMLLHEAKN
ncbi:hypothetical protein PCC6912_25200 [Chlorogloeopsis fritschii PCC 6912]|uniref:D-isomer specific 2-hydroxyacid dehydrogenase NAD-binding domain-containing protein n=2 Tax=Chlorogloeopsis fritschii TaxID=1124 RepID=A0A3S0ZT70_CHLFR|nr:hypothetical protein PCC6912_25200 [Chlorogloeopsis fritschii PCC 6912]